MKKEDMISLPTIKKPSNTITKLATAVFHRPLIVWAICINTYLFFFTKGRHVKKNEAKAE